MKMCVLLSSYEGSDSVFAEYDAYQDPSRYVSLDYHHQFTLEYIRKEGANERLDCIIKKCKNGEYDLIWNFLWGTPDYGQDMAGLDAIKHMETENIEFIGPSSKYLAMTKADVKRRVELMGAGRVNSPKWTLASLLNMDNISFPVILKPMNGCGSEYMTKDSVCVTMGQLETQLTLLRGQLDAKGLTTDILVEEFIAGREMSAMVLETMEGVVALTPLIYDFPPNWNTQDRFLHFDNKFRLADKVGLRLFDDDAQLVKRIKRTAVDAFCLLGVRGCGYARVDFRVRDEDGEIFLLEVNSVPAFFSAVGNPFGDDMVIERTFPGGHSALIDACVDAKMKYLTLGKEFGGMAPNYESCFAELCNPQTGHPINQLLEIGGKFGFCGSVLDVGAGTGIVGRAIYNKQKHGNGNVSELGRFTGIEFSQEMAEICTGIYSKVIIGRMENAALELWESGERFDQVVSFLAFPFIDPQSFPFVLDAMFAMARDAVTVCVDAIPPEYNEIMRKIQGPKFVGELFDHTQTVADYSVPPGWTLVYKRREPCWTSPRTGVMVHSDTIRWERNIQINQENGH